MSTAPPAISLPARYRVVRHVANGGMASVWAAEDGLLGRLVAVKVLAAHIAEDPDSRQRFAREARTAARVSEHPNVATVYDVGDHDGRPFIVMELLAGGSVADRLREGIQVPRPQALDWLEQAAAALDYAHGQDIVHRDVKPANLLLDERGRLAVGDFGIARYGDETGLTQAGTVLGTAAYLAPEQVLARGATAASDRYALGVVAFELLGGRRPFTGEHLAAQARAHVEDPPPPSGLGDDVDAVLHHALDKEPERRHPTALRFVGELREAVGRSGQAATAPTRPATRPTRPATAPAPAAAAPAPPATEPAGADGEDDRPDYARQRAGAGRGRLVLAGVAALALVVVLLAVLSGGDDGGRIAGDPGGAPSESRSAEQSPPAADEAEPATPEPAPADPAPAEPDPAPDPEPAPAEETDAAAPTGDPAALNDQGFTALNAGDVDRAIELLEASDRGFAAQGDDANSQTWGFALFNLGQAYERAGRPADAVDAYERRLEVSPTDQRATVERALARARAAAG